MNLDPLEFETPGIGKTVETRRTLTLAEFGHDADRDRPTHLFYGRIRRHRPATSPLRHPRQAAVPAAPRHTRRGHVCRLPRNLHVDV